MADVVIASKKKSPAKAKKPRTTPSHPKVSEMVVAAVSNLKERSGSSLQAIKKYIASRYKVDVEKIASFVRKYLKTAVASGVLIQTKGKGASGSFKLGTSKKMEKSVPKAKAPGEVKEKKAVSRVPKKNASKPKAKKPKQKSKKVKKAKAPKPKKTVKAVKSKSAAPKQSA